jgi:hypothetical protein
LGLPRLRQKSITVVNAGITHAGFVPRAHTKNGHPVLRPCQRASMPPQPHVCCMAYRSYAESALRTSAASGDAAAPLLRAPAAADGVRAGAAGGVGACAAGGVAAALRRGRRAAALRRGRRRWHAALLHGSGRWQAAAVVLLQVVLERVVAELRLAAELRRGAGKRRVQRDHEGGVAADAILHDLELAWVVRLQPLRELRVARGDVRRRLPDEDDADALLHGRLRARRRAAGRQHTQNGSPDKRVCAQAVCAPRRRRPSPPRRAAAAPRSPAARCARAWWKQRRCRCRCRCRRSRPAGCRSRR